MFLIHSVDDGRNLPLEYLPVSAITPKAGMALVMSSGNLAIATGANAPSYISMVEKESACTAGELIPVVRVGHDVIFETEFSESAAGITLGNKVTLHASNGLQVTATTQSGVAEVVGMEGTASGSKCLVRF